MAVTNTAETAEDITLNEKYPLTEHTSNDSHHHGANTLWNEKARPENEPAGETEPLLVQGAAGRLPEDVYERTLSTWRNAIRKSLNNTVQWETRVLSKMQEYVRHPILDVYFVYTSSLGTHTFFMIMIPALFFFGHMDFGRRLIMVLALGVYTTSFIKDLMCSPRPYAPPVTRLMLGNHHLEYGFPSTHCTNSVSIALMFFSVLRELYVTPVLPSSPAFVNGAELTQNATEVIADILTQAEETVVSSMTYYVLSFVLLVYVFSIVYGRLYTGMHSFTDCTVGVIMGVFVYGIDVVFGAHLDALITNNGWPVPCVTIPLCLLLVHWHPQPVDDCPCFEDAIAFISVVMGEILVRWWMRHNGFDGDFFKIVMRGSSWATWLDVTTWFAIAALKLVTGILTIFAWRIFAKALFHMILPPIFRLLSHLFTLPHRRFYTPATDYTTMPPEKGLRPIPSVIDLPHMMELQHDEGGASGRRYGNAYGHSKSAVKLRNARVKISEKGIDSKDKTGLELEESGGKVDAVVKHYDADVLTKVFVYCGIALMSCGGIPIVFELLGWGC
ncbi:hypothetical protein BKA93DRAFT_797667 [Sparassis latifolia]